jgi:hypothetical protein
MDRLLWGDFQFRLKYGDPTKPRGIADWPISPRVLRICERAPRDNEAYRRIGDCFSRGSPNFEVPFGELLHTWAANLSSIPFNSQIKEFGVAGNQHGALGAGLHDGVMHMLWDYVRQDSEFFEVIGHEMHQGDFGSVQKAVVKPKSMSSGLPAHLEGYAEIKLANERLIESKRVCPVNLKGCNINHLIVLHGRIIGYHQLVLNLVADMFRSLNEFARTHSLEKLPNDFCKDCPVFHDLTGGNMPFSKIPARCMRNQAMPCAASFIKMVQIANACIHEKTEPGLSHLTPEHKGSMELVDVELARIFGMIGANVAFLALGEASTAHRQMVHHYLDYFDETIFPKLEDSSLWQAEPGVFVTSPNHGRELFGIADDLLGDLEEAQLNPTDTAEYSRKIISCSPNMEFVSQVLAKLSGNPADNGRAFTMDRVEAAIQRQLKGVKTDLASTLEAGLDHLARRIIPPMILDERRIFNSQNGGLAQTLLALNRGCDSIAKIANKVVISVDGIERHPSPTQVRTNLQVLTSLRLHNWKMRPSKGRGKTDPNPGVLLDKGKLVAWNLETVLEYHPSANIQDEVVYSMANSMNNESITRWFPLSTGYHDS